MQNAFKVPVVFYKPLRIEELFHTLPALFTKLFVVCTLPADCSLGDVKQLLEDSEELRAGGLYLMPEAVTCNGELVLVETCAFLNQLMNTTLFRLRVAVYRENGADMLDMIYQQALNIRSNATQDCGSLPRRWSVKKGDRVGVQIRDTCDTPAGSDPACPAQANLINAACASALYHTSDRPGRITLTEVTTVGVNLNVRVSIGKCSLTLICIQLGACV